MTIKKRLFLSNLLMIIVPVIVTVIAGFLCMGLMYYSFSRSMGYDLEDSEDFHDACESISRCAVYYLEMQPESIDKRTRDMERLIDASSMRVEIVSGSHVVYSYGETAETDGRLMQIVEMLDEPDVMIMIEDRGICKMTRTVNGKDYRIFIMGTQEYREHNGFRLVICLFAVILMFAVFMSILGTDRFLIRFVFKKIETPLDILATGVQEIGSGNLDYRIIYTEKDEFYLVCEAFNEMAVRLKESVEQTRRNEESRKELMAGLSHDLRSPLTSIQAYVEGLLDGIADTPEAKQTYLLTIKRKAEDIDSMVSQMFTFSKLELKEYPMELKEVQLDFEIRQMVSECMAEYEKKGLVLSISTMPQYIAKADYEQLGRVIRNIMDNSVKYRIKEEGHLDVSIKSNGEYCELTLSDDGPGVPEEILPKLFDVFYRSDPARKNPAGGSGLGLAIAAKIMERMGGSIRAENVSSGGLSIVITLKGREGNLHGKDFDY